MRNSRYYTIGAIVRDLRSLEVLEGRVWNLDLPDSSMVVLARGRDERLIEAILPEAEVRRVETGLSKAQWLEFASTYLGVTAVSVLMGAVHLPTGLIVQAVLTLAAIIGLIVYNRRPHLQKKLLELALPEKLADEWNDAFPSGMALILVTVPEEYFDEAQETFLEQDGIQAPLAVDRRPVL
ncbi:MAG: hypothetical protein M3Q54_01215 [Actinomycetota bacterium]|jgi:hypothetical protein|nr:hypothetical protein [Actinomycetota bacterium]